VNCSTDTLWWTTQSSMSCANSQRVTIWLTHQLWRNSSRQSHTDTHTHTQGCTMGLT